jgi:hypothetical protein
VLITVVYKQEGAHKEFVPEGKTVSSEFIIRTDNRKSLMERILRERQLVPFCKTIPLLRGSQIFQKM